MAIETKEKKTHFLLGMIFILNIMFRMKSRRCLSKTTYYSIHNFKLIFLIFEQCESQQQKSTRGSSIAPLENERKNWLWCHFSYLPFYMYVSAHLCRPTLLSIKVHAFLEFKWISYIEYCTCLKYCNHLFFFVFWGPLDFSLKAHLAII